MDLWKKTKCGHCGKEFSYMLEKHDMGDCFEALRKENERLRAEIGEAGSPPPLGSWMQRALAAENKLAKVMVSLEFIASQNVFATGRYEAFANYAQDSARRALAAVKGE